jgi:hypothetical protein
VTANTDTSVGVVVFVSFLEYPLLIIDLLYAQRLPRRHAM